jgi:hypothetical protein
MELVAMFFSTLFGAFLGILGGFRIQEKSFKVQKQEEKKKVYFRNPKTGNPP